VAAIDDDVGRNQISARTRGLGVELKELRAAAGLNTRDAARKVGLSSATLNRIELGTRPATPEEVFGLLIVYDVPTLERERLLEMAREAAMPGWWEGSNYSGLSKHLYAVVNFESEATRIINVALSLVPGLLQTPNYIRALLTSLGRTEPEVEKRVAVRAGRHVVLSKPRPPHYLAIIDEAALRRRLGRPAMMAEQLRHILVEADRPNVTVLVVPFAKGGYRGMISPFQVIGFAKAPTVVFLEHIHSSVFLDQPADTMPFQRAIDSIAEAALGPADSADFIARIADEYERE
jgi:transcriptional regulator with XRE-family HTH domain